MFDVVALGELLIDFTPGGKSAGGQALYERNPGGAPANVLAALAKLNKSTAFIGKVGDDAFGRFLRETLQQAGIDAVGLTLAKNVPTTLAFAHLQENGDRSFSFYRKPGADMMLAAEELPLDVIAKAQIFHFGSVSMTAEPSRTATLRAAGFAKERGLLVSYDPNLREPLWDSLEEAHDTILEGMPYADIVKVSAEELAFLTGTPELADGARKLLERYATPLLLVTMGAGGCYYCAGDRSGHVPGIAVKSVDTTGAGDGFLGGLLSRILEHGPRLVDYTAEELAECVRFANAVGALVTTRRGAIPAMPDFEEIRKLLRRA